MAVSPPSAAAWDEQAGAAPPQDPAARRRPLPSVSWKNRDRGGPGAPPPITSKDLDFRGINANGRIHVQFRADCRIM